MGAVSNWIAREYGMRTRTTERVVALTAAGPVVVLQNDPNRIAWRAFNLSAGTAYLGFTGAVAAANGIQINPTGGSVGLVVRDDLELPTHIMYGISTANVNLYVIETLVTQEM